MSSEEHTPEKMQRLFVAVELPDAVREALTELQKGLSGMRWTAPNNLHLTLRFIGEVPLTQVGIIKTVLETVQVEEFSLDIHGLGFFDKRPQAVLWGGVAASEELALLKRQVDTALEKHAGLKADNNHFSPHITLGRAKQADRKILRDFVAQNGESVSATFPVRSFTLFSSVLAPGGAEHTIEARYNLTCE